jgi:hypothetical protein
MMSEEPEKYQQVLHMLVFRAQQVESSLFFRRWVMRISAYAFLICVNALFFQCNNEKILENPYLQMRGILQLANDVGSNFMFQET